MVDSSEFSGGRSIHEPGVWFWEFIPADSGDVQYGAPADTWLQTSPLMAAIVYERMASEGIPPQEIQLDPQLIFYNDIFGWARVAFYALTGRSALGMMSGPSPEDLQSIPGLGNGQVLDAIHNLLHFAANVLTMGNIEHVVRREYVTSLAWYHVLEPVLASSRIAED